MTTNGSASIAVGRDPRLNIDPAQVGAAVGIAAATAAEYRLTDAYGVTYTGAPAHLALSALARRDLTRDVYPDQPAVAVGLRDTALTLIDWVTSPFVDPQHAAEFVALPAIRVCELVVYLFVHGNADVLTKVGPASLRYYTEHLLHDSVPSVEHPMPQLIDQPYRSLGGSEASPRRQLQVTATAAGGADEVGVPMEIEGSEEIYWRFVAAIPVPVDELNELLLDPDYFVDDYLSENRDVIDQYLVYRDSQSEEGIAVNGRLVSPSGTAVDATPAVPVEVKLFFTGPDREAALQTAPFSSRGAAEQSAAAGERIFRVSIEVDADAVDELT